MHQNGRDTHLRQVKVYGRRTAAATPLNGQYGPFLSIEMNQYAVLR
jgi:hypothetical protein